LHLAAHHWPDPDLLWLYDLRALADAMTPSEAAEFDGVAAVRGFSTLASHVLRAARELFPSAALDALIVRLPEHREEPALQLLSRRGALDKLRLDLRYASSRQRFRLVREHLFPDREYMRASSRGAPLAAAYAHRIARGARRWLSKSS